MLTLYNSVLSSVINWTNGCSRTLRNDSFDEIVPFDDATDVVRDRIDEQFDFYEIKPKRYKFYSVTYTVCNLSLSFYFCFFNASCMYGDSNDSKS